MCLFSTIQMPGMHSNFCSSNLAICSLIFPQQHSLNLLFFSSESHISRAFCVLCCCPVKDVTKLSYWFSFSFSLKCYVSLPKVQFSIASTASTEGSNWLFCIGEKWIQNYPECVKTNLKTLLRNKLGCPHKQNKKNTSATQTTDMQYIASE